MLKKIVYVLSVNLFGLYYQSVVCYTTWLIYYLKGTCICSDASDKHQIPFITCFVSFANYAS